MPEYEASTYGERIADAYDALHPDYDAAAIDVLAELAGAGSVLELGIGTGRLALPLAARGLNIHGVDASNAMVTKLKAKPGGAAIPVTIADFGEFSLSDRYSLIFIAFNTFFALLTQEAQVQCFRRVAAHLSPGGAFVLEAFVPDLTRFDLGQRVAVSAIKVDQLSLEVARHDAATQRIDSQHVILSESGVRIFPVQLRYAWPSELDLMAMHAGLARTDRWANWHRQPFGSSSQFHVSVYRNSPK